MKLSSDQIGEVEQLADRLNEWQKGNMPRAIANFSRYIQLTRFVEPQANVVLMDLSADMPEIVRVIHVKLKELLRKASQVDILRQEDADEARREYSNLLRLAREFVLMLEPIVKNADHDALTLNDAEQEAS